MKFSKMFIFVLLLLPIFLGGCSVYGRGESQGVIYAVDDGIVWDKVFFKPALESTESDCYLIDDDNLKADLRNLPDGTRIKIYYYKHLITVATCDGATEDEIYKYEILSLED